MKIDFPCGRGPSGISLARLFVLGLAALSFLVYAEVAEAQYAQQAKLVGAGGGSNARQGHSVAMSGDGSTLIIGGPYAELEGPGLSFIGRAWVYRRNGAGWRGEAVLRGANTDFSPFGQGYAVALSRDGNTAIVGGPGDGLRRGQAWIYRRVGGNWVEEASMFGADAAGLAQQGWSVAISKDGDTAIIGGPFDNGGAGAAWVFRRTNGVWSQQGGKLVADDSVGNAWQGVSVALSGDGDAALVGGPLDNGGVGAAWLYGRLADGTWKQLRPKLVGAGAVNARQGFAVALSRPGNVALVGGPQDAGGVGAAWVFQRSRGVWREQAKLVGAGSVGAANQGLSVALSRNGGSALLGGPYDDSTAGAAWAFTRWNGQWSQQGAKLVGSPSVGAAFQGRSVSLSGSGNIALVGGPLDNGGVGAAWVFYRSFSGTPLLASCYTQSVTALTDRFGGLNTAAWSLGYGMANVTPLESALHAYCGDSPASAQRG